MQICDPIANDAEAAPQLVLRSLTLADADKAAEVIRTAFAAQSRPTSPPSSALLETGQSIAAKIAAGGGFGAFDGDALHVARVSVAPRERGRGIARSLIAACEAKARALRFRRMTLKTRLELPENEGLFEHCGFARREVEAHPGFEGPTTAVMEKILR